VTPAGPGHHPGMTQPHEDVPDIVTTDPGPRQEPGQGEQTPEEVGTTPPEDPDGEPPFV